MNKLLSLIVLAGAIGCAATPDEGATDQAVTGDPRLHLWAIGAWTCDVRYPGTPEFPARTTTATYVVTESRPVGVLIGEYVEDPADPAARSWTEFATLDLGAEETSQRYIPMNMISSASDGLIADTDERGQERWQLNTTPAPNILGEYNVPGTLQLPDGRLKAHTRDAFAQRKIGFLRWNLLMGDRYGEFGKNPILQATYWTANCLSVQ